MRCAFVPLLLFALACDSAYFEVYDGGTAPDASDGGPPPSECTTFEARAYPLAATGAAFIALPLDDSTVLLGTRDGDRHYYAVTADGPLALAAETPNIAPLAAKKVGDELWIAGELRSLYHGTFDRTSGFNLTVITPAPPQELRFLDVAPTDQPLEAFAIGQRRGEGNLHRFDGSAWQTIWTRAQPYTEQSPDYGAVVYVAPNEAYAVPRGSECNTLTRCVLHYDANGVVEQPADSTELLTTIASIPGVGMLVADRLGQLLRFEGAGWSVIPGAPRLENFYPATIIRHILSFGTGAIYFSDRRVFQWYPSTGYCPEAIPYGDALQALYAVVPIREGFVLAGGAPDQAMLQVVVLINRGRSP